ncbi:MAG: hypothetical protein AB1779_11665, partial [Candidatus Thermoplasmatota archaeon]
ASASERILNKVIAVLCAWGEGNRKIGKHTIVNFNSKLFQWRDCAIKKVKSFLRTGITATS